jgi:uncharacterized membrane protein (UPF0127 family)
VRRAVVVGIIAAAIVIGLWFILQGANRPADPSFVPSVGGFEEQGFSIVAPGEAAGASSAEHCALLAETAEQRSRGLMGRRDLDGYDGMVFRFERETTSTFTMAETLIPLSIAWFDASGTLVDQAEMTPCPEGVNCPSYASDRPYRYALEVPVGDLERLGVVSGSRLILGGGCA